MTKEVTRTTIVFTGLSVLSVMYVSNGNVKYKKGVTNWRPYGEKVDEKDILLYLGELQDVKMKIWFVTN